MADAEEFKPFNHAKTVKLSISRKQCGHTVCVYTDTKEVYNLLQMDLATACETCIDLENNRPVNPDTIYLCGKCHRYSETCQTDKEGDWSCEYCGSPFIDKYCIETAYDYFIKHKKQKRHK